MDFLEENVLIPLGMINTEYGKSTITGREYAKGYMDPSQDEPALYHDMSIPWAAGAPVQQHQGYGALGGVPSFTLLLITEQDREDYLQGRLCGLMKWKYGFACVHHNAGTTKPFITLVGSINGFTSEILMFPNDEAYIVILGKYKWPAC